MLWLRVAALVATGYVVLVALVWLFQERIAFPAPRGAVPLPDDVGMPYGKRIELTTRSGIRLAGWYLAPRNPTVEHPGLLWFYGNGETIADIWPVLRDFQPPNAALLVVDYPGYGGSAGRATEQALYEAADAAYAALRHWPGVDPGRLYVYGRSLGTAAATYTAAHYPVKGLILESPFTSAREMSRRHYGLFPAFIVRLRLDNLGNMPRIHCPVLVIHGSSDLLVPPAMGRRVAAAAAGPVELVTIARAGHNETYEVGGGAYKEKLWSFVK